MGARLNFIAMLQHYLLLEAPLCYNTLKSTFKETIVTISANEIKQRGVSFFDELLNKFDELIINVRGKDKYVVLDIERYKEFRANELDLAYMQMMHDMENGNYKTQNAQEHLAEMKVLLKDEL